MNFFRLENQPAKIKAVNIPIKFLINVENFQNEKAAHWNEMTRARLMLRNQEKPHKRLPTRLNPHKQSHST